jgi:hypothetical protein
MDITFIDSLFGGSPKRAMLTRRPIFERMSVFGQDRVRAAR